MRQFLLLISLMLASASVCAYRPMVEEGNQWSVVNLNAVAEQNGEVSVTSTVQKIVGDTICDGKQFKKLIYTSDKAQSSWSVHALLRETDKKVWAFKDGKEYLVYDFDVKVGDKLTLHNSVLSIEYSFEPTDYTVSKIDSVVNRLGEKIARYELTSNDKTDVVYERYGSICGWLRRDSDGIVGGGIDRLRCFQNAQSVTEIVLELPWPEIKAADDECTIWTNIKSSIDDVLVMSNELFYNYITGCLNMDIDGEKSINIYSMQGFRLLSSTTNSKVINVELESGIYIVEIITDDKRYSSKLAIR